MESDSSNAPGAAAPRAARSRRRAGFDFTLAMERLCRDVTTRLPEMGHVRMDEVAVNFARARKRVTHGIFASLTPLRFPGGKRTDVRRGRPCEIETIVGPGGREMLYLLTFYLPRFMDLCFQEKLITVMHELWHISPDFDGDLRRFPGRCHVHTGSKEQYDREMAVLAQAYLERRPPQKTTAFLYQTFNDLIRDHGQVHGVTYRHPRIVFRSVPATRMEDRGPPPFPLSEPVSIEPSRLPGRGRDAAS